MIRLGNKFLLLCATALSAMVLYSCVKSDPFFGTETGDANRKQIVALGGADMAINVVARDVNPTVDEFALITITRSPSSQSELNSSLTVKLQRNSALISAYNTAHNTSYVELPAAAYTIIGDLNSITFQPGEMVKEIKIRLDKSQLSLSSQYAIGFTIAEASPGQINPSMKNVLFSVGIKNQFDGTYRLRGAFYHPTAAPSYNSFQTTVEMHTSGPNSVKMYYPDFGGYYHPWVNEGTGAFTAFGSQEPNYIIDPVTNKVTVVNSFPGAVTNYTMNPNYDSRYDPATKTIYAKWGYSYVGGQFTPGTSREFTDTLTRTGPR